MTFPPYNNNTQKARTLLPSTSSTSISIYLFFLNCCSCCCCCCYYYYHYHHHHRPHPCPHLACPYTHLMILSWFPLFTQHSRFCNHATGKQQALFFHGHLPPTLKLSTETSPCEPPVSTSSIYLTRNHPFSKYVQLGSRRIRCLVQ